MILSCPNEQMIRGDILKEITEPHRDGEEEEEGLRFLLLAAGQRSPLPLNRINWRFYNIFIHSGACPGQEEEEPAQVITMKFALGQRRIINHIKWHGTKAHPSTGQESRGEEPESDLCLKTFYGIQEEDH